MQITPLILSLLTLSTFPLVASAPTTFARASEIEARIKAVEDEAALRSVSTEILSNDREEVSLLEYYEDQRQDALKYNQVQLFNAAILADNFAAFRVFLQLGLDPLYKDSNFPLSAQDTLCFSKTKTPEQRRMQEELNALALKSGSQTAVCAAIDPIKFAYLARVASYAVLEQQTDFKIESFRDGKKALHDGSTIVHQAVLGNNLTLLRTLVKRKWNLHATWQNVSIVSSIFGLSETDKICGLNPPGNPPIAFALALNNISAAKIILEGSSQADILALAQKAPFLRRLAYTLPLQSRSQVLNLLQATVPAWKDANTCKPHATLIAAVAAKAPETCLHYFYWKGGEITEAFLVEAIASLNITDLKDALSEAASALIAPAPQSSIFNYVASSISNVFSSSISSVLSSAIYGTTENSTHQSIWQAIKKRAKFGTIDDLVDTFALLVEFDFTFDNPTAFPDSLSPWREVLEGKITTTKTSLLSSSQSTLTVATPLNLLKAMTLTSPFMVDVNRLTGFPESPPILHALLSKNYTVFSDLLKIHEDCSMNIQGDFDSAHQENLLHLAIRHMPDNATLIEVVTYLTTKFPHILNKPSFVASVNSITYTKGAKKINYVLHKRSGWTPLIYAVFLRKNLVAKHLVNALKADKTTVKGSDGLSLTQVIETRCKAYQDHVISLRIANARKEAGKSSSKVVDSNVPPSIQELNQKFTKQFVRMATKYIDDRIRYTP